MQWFSTFFPPCEVPGEVTLFAKKQLRCEVIFVGTLFELLGGGNQAVLGDQVKDL